MAWQGGAGSHEMNLTSQVAHESGTHEMLTMSSSSLQDPPSPIPSIAHSSSVFSLPEQATLSVARRPSSTLTFRHVVQTRYLCYLSMDEPLGGFLHPSREPELLANHFCFLDPPRASVADITPPGFFMSIEHSYSREFARAPVIAEHLKVSL